MRKIIVISSLLCLFILSGCATQMEPPFDHPAYQNKPWKLRKVRLSNTTSWDMSGAVSITSRGNTQMGSFAWQQRGQGYGITMYGPLNLGAIGIQGRPGLVTLIKPTGRFNAPNAETLMQQQLGWYLPISNMYFWVRGLPAPGIKGKSTHDEYGHLITLQQQGWTLQFQAYQNRGDVDLPRKMIMDNQQLHVKLVIKNWDLHG